LVEAFDRKLLLLIPILLLMGFRAKLSMRQLPEKRELSVAI